MFKEIVERVPSPLTFPCSTVQPLEPGLYYRPSKTTQTPVVASDTVVMVVTTQFGTQSPMLLPYWEMHILLAPLGYILNLGSQTFACCFPFDYPVSPFTFGPVVGET